MLSRDNVEFLFQTETGFGPVSSVTAFVEGSAVRWLLTYCSVPMPATYFIVRATISDPAQRAGFDAWYRDEHLPDAVKSFGAQKAWRFWSETDPAVHIAQYRFGDRAALDHGTRPEIMKRLVADFDRAWPGIPRSREIITLAEEYGA